MVAISQDRTSKSAGMIFKFVLTFFFISNFLAVVHLERKSYYRYKLFRLFPNTTQAKKFVDDFDSSPDIDIWRYSSGQGDPLDVMVSPNFIPGFTFFVKDSKMPYTILTENVGRAVDMEIMELRSGLPVTKRGIAFDRYMRYEEIEQYLKEVEMKFADLVQRSVIGKSFEGRDISLIKINSQPKPQPIILIDAGIHAREWISISMALYIINQLTEHCEENAHLLNGLEWHIIPLMNPDGYEYSHTHNRFWRKTRSHIPGSYCVGVDGNRNYDFHWNVVGTSPDPCSDTYAGPSAFSESETRALRDHALSMAGRVRMYLSFHSYGNWILHPWGFVKALPKNGEELTKLGLKASNISVEHGGAAYKVGGSAIMLYEAAGGSDDWMLAQANVPMSYTVELTDHPDGFILPPSEILHSVEMFFKPLSAFAQHAIDNN